MRRAAVFVLVAGAALASTLALAQTKPGAPHRPKARTATGDAGPAPPHAAASPVKGEGEQPPDTHPLDAGAIESRTLDGGTRVFRFGEVEVEGRLRNPQLVYFLRRVRAEFAAGDLGHRSFMRELSDTRHDPSF
jgi:hypothetical protein